MTHELPSNVPAEPRTLESIKQEIIRGHERDGILFASIATVCTAATLASPYFAYPALSYWLGAVLEFKNVPSMNPPAKS
jgi:hypothetical protein